MSQTAIRPRRERMSYGDYIALGETLHHEYFDGWCEVNPPSRRHVKVARRITRILEDAAPPHLEVLPEFGWHMAEGYDFEPDIMVAERGAPGPDLLRVAPLIIVEVVSPSTRSVDMGRKMELYASGGCPIYWVVDPENDLIQVYYNEAGRFVRGVTVHPWETAHFEMVFDFTLDGPAIFAD